MLGYFIRRIVQGLILWVLALLVSFTFLVESPLIGMRALASSPGDMAEGVMHPEAEALRRKVMNAGDPWPINFLTWLYDPEAPDLSYLGENASSALLPRIPVVSPEPNPFRLWRDHTSPAGVLTGRLGYSLVLWPGQPVGDLVGPFWWIVLALLGALMALVGVMSIQRWGRPWPHRPHHRPHDLPHDVWYLKRPITFGG